MHSRLNQRRSVSRPETCGDGNNQYSSQPLRLEDACFQGTTRVRQVQQAYHDSLLVIRRVLLALPLFVLLG